MSLAVCEGFHSIAPFLHILFSFIWHWANIITYFDVRKVKSTQNKNEMSPTGNVIEFPWFIVIVRITFRLFHLSHPEKKGQKYKITENLVTHRNQHEIYEFVQIQKNNLETESAIASVSDAKMLCKYHIHFYGNWKFTFSFLRSALFFGIIVIKLRRVNARMGSCFWQHYFFLC